ncbi:glycosyltransferase [Lunatibacter salilacus]|uniref:glycosyltransferase n=1 Tax=Lunatibacter salilacus TaxID=2483804 RepID=UPI00131DBFA7|nr:glycosyltransferase [Lunatibacter salilacus]
MKIVRITPLLDFGGVEKRIKHTVIGFKLLSYHSISVVVLGKRGKISEELQSIGTHTIHLNQDFRIPNIILIFKLYRLLKNIRPDVVHTSASEANFHGLIAAKMSGVPVRIGEEIGFPNHDWKWRVIFKWVYKTATKVIAISYAVKQRIVDLGEVDESKVLVVYNPVELGNRSTVKSEKEPVFTHCTSVRNNKVATSGNDNAQWIRKCSQKENQIIFVTTCRLVPVKNLDTLIRVFAEMMSKNNDLETKLWIVGDGPEREKLESLVVHLRITSRVIFWGFQENVTSFLVNADAFVLPSFSEGFSISLVEAMLGGLPCIATNQGGPPEIIQEGRTGFLINPNSKIELEQKMEKILFMSKEEREGIGKAAKIDAERYSVENYVNRLVGIYSQLLRENRVGGEN